MRARSRSTEARCVQSCCEGRASRVATCSRDRPRSGSLLAGARRSTNVNGWSLLCATSQSDTFASLDGDGIAVDSVEASRGDEPAGVVRRVFAIVASVARHGLGAPLPRRDQVVRERPACRDQERARAHRGVAHPKREHLVRGRVRAQGANEGVERRGDDRLRQCGRRVVRAGAPSLLGRAQHELPLAGRGRTAHDGRARGFAEDADGEPYRRLVHSADLSPPPGSRTAAALARPGSGRARTRKDRTVGDLRRCPSEVAEGTGTPLARTAARPRAHGRTRSAPATPPTPPRSAAPACAVRAWPRPRARRRARERSDQAPPPAAGVVLPRRGGRRAAGPS